MIDYRPIKLRAQPPGSKRETANMPVVQRSSPRSPRHTVWLTVCLVVLFVRCFVVLALMFD